MSQPKDPPNRYNPEIRETLENAREEIIDVHSRWDKRGVEEWRHGRSQAYLEAPQEDFGLEAPNRQCAATSKNTGERCTRLAMHGMLYCYHHRYEKRAGVGIQNHNFRTGSTSKYLPKHLYDRTLEQLNDTELLALDETIAVAAARTTELYERLQASAPITQRGWELVLEALNDLDYILSNAMEDEELQVGLLQERIQRLRHQAALGASEEKVWRQITVLWEQRRKLIESERKRLVEMQQMMTSADIMALAIRLMESVKRNVRDQDVLEAIQRDFASTVGYRPMEHKPLPGTEHLFPE